MHQQVLSNVQKGLTSAYISEDTNEDIEFRRGIIGGQYQLMYFTPESLLLDMKWRKLLKSSLFENRLKALVFDEMVMFNILSIN